MWLYLMSVIMKICIFWYNDFSEGYSASIWRKLSVFFYQISAKLRENEYCVTVLFWSRDSVLKWSELKWVTVKFFGTKVPYTLRWPCTESTWVYLPISFAVYLVLWSFCNAWVSVCGGVLTIVWVFSNMCTCIYCVLYCLYCFYCFFYVYLFIFVLSVLVYELLPPSENSIALVVVVVVVIIIIIIIINPLTVCTAVYSHLVPVLSLYKMEIIIYVLPYVPFNCFLSCPGY